MDLATDNSATAVVDNPNPEPTAVVNGTGATDGQAQGQQANGGAPEDIFKNIDPNKLPPQLKTVYDSMLTDYRTKTAKISETIKTEKEKAIEAYRQKAEYYDSIAGQEEFVKQWNEYVQKVNQTPKSEQAGDPVLAQMKAQLQEMNQKIQISELSQITEAFAEAKDEKGQAIHPQFDELNNIHIGKLANGDKAEDFSLLRGCVELAQGANPQEKLANGYKMAKAVYDGIFEAGKKAGMGRLAQKAQNGTQPPTNISTDALSVTDKKPKNAREALEMARKGQMVSRD